jgi:hypothetical protein
MSDVAPTPAPARGLFARFVGVVTSPRKTFEEIVQAPRFLGAMLLVAVVSGLAIGLFFSSEVGKGAFLDMMASRQQAPNPQATQAMEKMLPYMGAMYGVGALIWVPISTTIISGILIGIFNVLMGGTANFRQMMAVVAHSQFVSVLGTLFVTPLNYARGTMTSTTNLAVFVPMLDENSFMVKFLGAIDLIMLWWLITLSIGLAALYRKKSSNVIIGFLSVYVIIALVIAYLRSS